MAKYKILYWQGIPSQVRATDENGRVNRPLPGRFQDARPRHPIGIHWGDEVEHPGTAQEAADAIATELDKKYPSVDWQSLIKREDAK